MIHNEAVRLARIIRRNGKEICVKTGHIISLNNEEIDIKKINCDYEW